MKRKLLLKLCLFFGIFVNNSSFAQAPYIMDAAADGLGEYGYIEKDALTFTRLNRNTYTNVYDLGARWYVTDNSGAGQEYVYWTENGPEWISGWNCSTNLNINHKRTIDIPSSDFASEWKTGADAYVSVYAKWCSGGQSHSSGQTGYNERHFKVVDFEPVAVTPSNAFVDGNGTCPTSSNAVVASFTLDVTGISGTSLSRFWFKNTGSAQETTNIPNDGFHLFYEPYTGSESYSGSESAVTLYGNWGGNSTSNNEYGSDGLSIPLSGKMRFYIVICDVTQTINLSGTQPFNIELLNDGLSLSPTLDSHGKMRINVVALSNASPLPVNLTGFSATTIDEKVKLDWETASETNNAYFEIERSVDVKSFAKIGQVAGQINSSELIQYSFIDEQPQSGINYYRLRQVDLDGKFEYSKIRSAIVEKGISVNISPNPTDDYIVLRGLPENSSFEIVDLNGSNKYQKLVKDNAAEHRVNVSQYGSGLYIVRIISGDKVEVRKFFIN